VTSPQSEEKAKRGRFGLIAPIPVWVRVPVVISLVLAAVLIATAVLGSAGGEGPRRPSSSASVAAGLAAPGIPAGASG